MPGCQGHPQREQSCQRSLSTAMARATGLSLVLATTLGIAAPSAATRRGYDYGPPDLQEVCAAGVCHRFGKISAPLDHDDLSQGEWELTYFVNSDYWDPTGDRACSAPHTSLRAPGVLPCYTATVC